jgi:hypothetical protein
MTKSQLTCIFDMLHNTVLSFLVLLSFSVCLHAQTVPERLSVSMGLSIPVPPFFGESEYNQGKLPPSMYFSLSYDKELLKGHRFGITAGLSRLTFSKHQFAFIPDRTSP